MSEYLSSPFQCGKPKTQCLYGFPHFQISAKAPKVVKNQKTTYSSLNQDSMKTNHEDNEIAVSMAEAATNESNAADGQAWLDMQRGANNGDATKRVVS